VDPVPVALADSPVDPAPAPAVGEALGEAPEAAEAEVGDPLALEGEEASLISLPLRENRDPVGPLRVSPRLTIFRRERTVRVISSGSTFLNLNSFD